jgi:hypothetical protein
MVHYFPEMEGCAMGWVLHGCATTTIGYLHIDIAEVRTAMGRVWIHGRARTSVTSRRLPDPLNLIGAGSSVGHKALGNAE